MMLRVLIFGPEAARAGRDHVPVTLNEDRTCGAVLRAVALVCPAIAPMLAGARLAVNSKFADAAQVVRDGDEVALIGMVSGG
jgi:molybdopterin converting factor small subunit